MSIVRSITSRGFNFSIGTLVRDAQRLLGALQDGTIASAVVVHLSPAFVGDFTVQVALVAKLDTDQSTAFGAVSTLTLAQAKAQRDFVLMASVARRTAKFALNRQGTILRSEFQVGVHQPQGIPELLARGRKLVTACQTYAAELAAYGWSSANTDALAAALDALTGADQSHEASKDEKRGLTVQRDAAAKRLYQQCVRVQGAAEIVFPEVPALGDSAMVEARARFLLGEFPPRRAATAAVAPVPSVTPVAVVAPAPLGPRVAAAAAASASALAAAA